MSEIGLMQMDGVCVKVGDWTAKTQIDQTQVWVGNGCQAFCFSLVSLRFNAEMRERMAENRNSTFATRRRDKGIAAALFALIDEIEEGNPLCP